MAKIALGIVGAVIGSIFGPIGISIGFALGSALGSVLFPGKLQPGPRLNDLQVTSATNGAPIPFGWGQVRVAGNIIWAPGLVEVTTTHSVKGGPKQTTYSYTSSFAVSFGEGPCAIGRIWFDSKIVHDPTGGTARITGLSQSGNTVTVTSTLNPAIGTQVTISGAPSGYNGKFKVALSSPVDFTYYNPVSGLAPGSTGTASFPLPVYAAPVIYSGTETQGADPTIQAAVGAANCPAFRGLCYAVWSNFPLTNFGNRLPNVRGEVTYQVTQTAVTGVLNFDRASNSAGSGQPYTAPSLTPQPSNASTFAWFFVKPQSNGSPSYPAGWSSIDGDPYHIAAIFNNGSVIAPSISDSFGGIAYDAMFAIFNYQGSSLPSLFNAANVSGAGINFTAMYPSANVAGNTLFAYFTCLQQSPGLGTLTDSHGNAWVQIASASSFSTGSQFLWMAANAIGGAGNVVSLPGTILATGASFAIYETTTGVLPVLNSPSLDVMVAAICTRARLSPSQIDVTQLASVNPPPGGYLITRPSTAQTALQTLALGYFFDGVESSGVLKFVLRGGATQALAIPESDLGLYKDNYKITEQIGQIQDLPFDYQVLFNDRKLDYQQNKAHKIRHRRIVKTRNQSIIELPLTIDSTTARQIAERSLFLAYLERHPYDFNLWRSLYILYDPTDVIQFTYEGLTFVMRILKSTIGADLQVVLSGVNENTSTYSSSVSGSSGTGVVPAGPNNLPDTALYLFDIPLTRDADANPSGSGYYAALGTLDPVHWPGASLEKSSDDSNFGQQDTDSIACSYGTALTTLPPPRSPWDWDTSSTLQVAMSNGSLAGTSDLNVLNGSNALLVGNPATGIWELLQFANSVQNPDGSYTISRLLRGRRGTEPSCGLHVSGETVVLLNAGGFLRESSSSAELQVLRYFRAVTYGGDVTQVPSTLFTNSGNDLRPYAPASLAATVDMSGNINMSWIRRTRIGGDWLNFIGQVPLSETTESYDLEIVDNGNGAVKRSFTALSSPSCQYTAAQQIADFGSLQKYFTFNVYQNSSLIGRGFKATFTDQLTPPVEPPGIYIFTDVGIGGADPGTVVNPQNAIDGDPSTYCELYVPFTHGVVPAGDAGLASISIQGAVEAPQPVTQVYLNLTYGVPEMNMAGSQIAPIWNIYAGISPFIVNVDGGVIGGVPQATKKVKVLLPLPLPIHTRNIQVHVGLEADSNTTISGACRVRIFDAYLTLS